MSHTVSLQVASGRNSGQQIVVRGRRFLIGRADDCHLRAHSEQISRYHCALLIESGKIFVRDYGSRNGTLIDGQRVMDRRELRDGQRLQVGPLDFRVCIREGPVSVVKDTAHGKLNAEAFNATGKRGAAQHSARKKSRAAADTNLQQAAQSIQNVPEPLDVMQFLTDPPATDAERRPRSQEPLPGLDEYLAAEKAAAERAMGAGETPPRTVAPAEEDTSDAAAEGLKRLFKPKHG